MYTCIHPNYYKGKVVSVVVGGGGVSARSVLRGDSRVEALYQAALFDVSWDLSVKKE